ncbi:MAG: HD domain-containing protein [Bacteroidetes bacterium]|nr:HD domain-containing protein [Bacteroidota bacterium]
MQSDGTTILESFYNDRYPDVVKRLKDEINPNYTYHCLNHVLDVIEAAERIAKAESVDESSLQIVKIAALYHDIGFLFQRKEHEAKSAEMFSEEALRFGLGDEVIIQITGCIMATKIPQNPQNLLEQIVCDADLDYLGRDDYDSIADTLYNEMSLAGELSDLEKWKQIQIQFLSNHNFHTAYSKNLRQPGLLNNLNSIR